MRVQSLSRNRKVVRVIPISAQYRGRCAGTSTLVLILMLVLSALSASSAIVTFEGLADGATLGNQFANLAFTNATVATAGLTLNEFEFPSRSGTNVAFDSGGPVIIDFLTPALTFSGYFTYGAPLNVTAFDSGDQQVNSATSSFSNNQGLSGVAGSRPNEFLIVASAGGIARVLITGDALGNSFAVDDIDVEFARTPIPEPAMAWPLLTAGAVLLAWKRSCRKQRS